MGFPAVWPGDERRGDALDAPARVRAAVDDHAALDPRERPVLAGADLQVRDLGGGRIRRLEVLAAREHEAHGALQRERRADCERLDERELAAERASERLGDDADALEREVEGAGELGAGDECALRARGDHEHGREPQDLIRAMDVKGRIDLQGRGSDVELENIAGQVTISGSFSGTLNFKNLGRPLQFEGTRGTELSAQAVPGRISMDLGEFSANDIVGPIRLVTRARDIKLEQFTHSVEVETERGDIEMTRANCRWRRSKRVRVRARSNCCFPRSRPSSWMRRRSGATRSMISVRRS